MTRFFFLFVGWVFLTSSQIRCDRCSMYRTEEISFIGPIKVKDNRCEGHSVLLASIFANLGKRSAVVSHLPDTKRRDLAYRLLRTKNLFPYLSFSSVDIPIGTWLHIDGSWKEEKSLERLIQNAYKKNLPISLYLTVNDNKEIFQIQQKWKKLSVLFIDRKEKPWTREEIETVISKNRNQSSLFFINRHGLWFSDMKQLHFIPIFTKEQMDHDYLIAGIMYALFRGKKIEDAIWTGRLLVRAIEKNQPIPWEKIKREISIHESMVYIQKEDYLDRGASLFDQYLSP